MTKHFKPFTWAVIALVLSCGIAINATESDVEETTESPIADMALVGKYNRNGNELVSI